MRIDLLRAAGYCCSQASLQDAEAAVPHVLSGPFEEIWTPPTCFHCAYCGCDWKPAPGSESQSPAPSIRSERMLLEGWQATEDLMPASHHGSHHPCQFFTYLLWCSRVEVYANASSLNNGSFSAEPSNPFLVSLQTISRRIPML